MLSGIPCLCQHNVLSSPVSPGPARCLIASKSCPAQRKPTRMSIYQNSRERAVPVIICAAAQRSDISTRQAINKPRSADTARTIVDIVAHGTLCTVGEDGLPLGTYCNYVLDDQGMPLIRLRADAVHTANLKRSPKCSLFVQPGTQLLCKCQAWFCMGVKLEPYAGDRPARLLARCTLIGDVAPLDQQSSELAAERHASIHPFGIGVDAVRPSDLYYRLNVQQCFYVGGMGANSAAELLTKDEYMEAQPDPLRDSAAFLVEQQNQQRAEDVLRICAYACSVRIDEMEHAQLLWIDTLGLYAYAKLIRQDGLFIRVPFLRPVSDERDARSTLTMLAQMAWESERSYIPVMPELVSVN